MSRFLLWSFLIAGCSIQPAFAQISALPQPFQIILALLIFMFSVPVTCKLMHLVRIQVNKIRNANLFGSNTDPEYADEYEDEDEF